MSEENKRTGQILPEKPFMKDDPLLFLILPLHFNMRHHVTYINIVKGLIVLYLQIFNVIGIVYICKDETQTYLRKYISVICGQQLGIVGYALHIYYTRTVFRFSEQLKSFLLPMDIAGSKVHREILRQCSSARKIFIFQLVLITAMYSSMLPFVGDEEDIEFTVMFIRKNFVWPTFFQGVYYLCLVSLGYSIAVLCSVGLYTGMHIKLQFYLLSQYLKQISNGYKLNNEDRIYQEAIRKKLNFFVLAHSKIKTVATMASDLSKWSVLGASIGTVFLYAALAYFLVAKVSPPSNFRIELVVISSVIITYFVTKSGQDLQNESVNLYNAVCQCQWVHWSVQNRRTLLMIIANTSKEIKLSSFGIVDLEYELIIRMLKVAYSTVLLFINVNK